MTTKINLDQYPQLKIQADYIIKVDGLIIKLKNRRNILHKEKFESEKEENERLISIDKTDLEIQTLEKQMVEKKRKYEGLIAMLDATLKEMELNYDQVVTRAKSTDSCSSILEAANFATEEGRLDLYLQLKGAIGLTDTLQENKELAGEMKIVE